MTKSLYCQFILDAMGDAIIDDPKGASAGKVLGKGWETGNFKTSIETNNDMAANGVLLILTKFPEFEAKFLKNLQTEGQHLAATESVYLYVCKPVRFTQLFR